MKWKIHPYLDVSREWHPEVTLENAIDALVNTEYQMVQSNGCIRSWGYVEYLPDVDVLSIKFPPDRFDGQDTCDPDVTLFFDKASRISEILIENASRRLDLDALRNEPQFEEIVEAVRSVG